jgi:hypothetical protein
VLSVQETELFIEGYHVLKTAFHAEIISPGIRVRKLYPPKNTIHASFFYLTLPEQLRGFLQQTCPNPAKGNWKYIIPSAFNLQPFIP